MPGSLTSLPLSALVGRPDRCGTCRYRERDDPADDEEPGGEVGGDCHRFPPAVSSMETDDEDITLGVVRFPGTEADDWCGEWAVLGPAKGKGKPKKRAAAAKRM